ncbi:GntR family transcriptional regulator [Achromobacter aloeverae]
MASIEEDAAPLRRQAEDALRRKILSGELAPGDRLKERELVELLGVSRTSLREALRQIEAEGLVTLEPNRGPVVAKLGYEDAEDLYEVRGVLEEQACAGFAARATSTHMKALKQAFTELRRLALAGDVEGTVRLSDVFYDAIQDGCGNRLLGRMLTQLHNRIVLLRRTSLSEPDRLPETLVELTEIYDALIARDERAAAAASRHHVRQAARVALRVLRSANE